MCCLSLSGVRKINEDIVILTKYVLYKQPPQITLYLSCSQLLCLKSSALARKGYPV